MDTGFAKEQSESVRLQILQQTATSALAQANNGPQSVLGFIGKIKKLIHTKTLIYYLDKVLYYK